MLNVSQLSKLFFFFFIKIRLMLLFLCVCFVCVFYVVLKIFMKSKPCVVGMCQQKGKSRDKL